jgi:hypothetical protein
MNERKRAAGQHGLKKMEKKETNQGKGLLERKEKSREQNRNEKEEEEIEERRWASTPHRRRSQTTPPSIHTAVDPYRRCSLATPDQQIILAIAGKSPVLYLSANPSHTDHDVPSPSTALLCPAPLPSPRFQVWRLLRCTRASLMLSTLCPVHKAVTSSHQPSRVSPLCKRTRRKKMRSKTKENRNKLRTGLKKN